MDSPFAKNFNALAKTISVSIPRSGHHLLVNILARYLSNDLYFDSRSIETGLDHSFFVCNKLVYCEYYNHCKTVPCLDHRTNVQKNHDFDLKLIVPNSYKAIIQYREDVIASFISEFNLGIETGVSKDTKEKWLSFLKKKINYWNGFKEKWLNKPSNSKLYILSYEELIKDPLERLKELLYFLEFQNPIDIERAQKCILSLDIMPQSNNIRSFKYYNAELEALSKKLKFYHKNIY